MKPSSPSFEDSSRSSDFDQPAFGVAEGVFPFHASGDLDLPSLPCEVTEVYRAEQGASFSHHSALMVFKGHLYCSWSSGMETEDAVGQSVSYRRTADGRTWSDLRRMAAPEGKDRLVSAGFLVNGDTLVAYHTRVPDYPAHNLRHRETALYAMTSQDGETWSQPVRVAGGFFIEGPLRLPGGRLIVGGENVGFFDEHKVRMRMLY